MLVTKEIEQKVKFELENEKIQDKLNAFGGGRNKSTKQFELKTECDLRAEVQHGATTKQNTVKNLSGGTSGDQEPK